MPDQKTPTPPETVVPSSPDKVISTNELRNRGKPPEAPVLIGSGPADQGPKRSQKQTGQSLDDPQEGAGQDTPDATDTDR